MKTLTARGTLSLLFGAHQFLLHPLMLALAWWILYGFPADPRLWLAFFLHDLGYAGKAQMDDEDGERHPELGARIMAALFGPAWGDFTLHHSRSYARAAGVDASPLCAADKLAFALEPAWLYLPRVWLSGELREYMNCAPGQIRSKYADEGGEAMRAGSFLNRALAWHAWASAHSRAYAYAYVPTGDLIPCSVPTTSSVQTTAKRPATRSSSPTPLNTP